MRSHRKAAPGHTHRVACWALTLTFVAIVVVLIPGAFGPGDYDYGYLAAAVALVAAGVIVGRLCRSRTRSAERAAYHRRFAQLPTIDASTTTSAVNSPMTDHREQAKHTQ